MSRRRLIGLAGAGVVVVAGASIPLVRFALDDGSVNARELDLLGVEESTFAPYIGDSFEIEGASGGAVTLISVEPRGARQFSLVFEGPGNRALGEQIHRLAHRRLGRFGLFMAPGRDRGTALTYEAAFNHGGV